MRISDWSSDVCSSDLRRTPVVEDLRARTAGAGHTHGPVVLALAEAQDELLGEPGDLLPEVQRLRVVGVDARVEAALLEAPDRQSVVQGKRVSVSVDPGGHRIYKKKESNYTMHT